MEPGAPLGSDCLEAGDHRDGRRPLRKGCGGGARISARLSEKLAQRYGQGGCKPIQHVYGRVLLPPLKSADDKSDLRQRRMPAAPAIAPRFVGQGPAR